MEKKKKWDVRTLALVGVLSALVFVLSWISIPFAYESRIHLGNIMCLLAGLLFGPWVGGLAAGLGSMLFDFTNPLYTPEFWITFITKFAMGFMAGYVCRKLEGRTNSVLRYGLAAFSGAGLYLVLYLCKTLLMQHFVMGLPWPAVWPVLAVKAATSGVNAVIAVVASVLLAPVLNAALNAAGLFRNKKSSPG